MHFTSSLRAPDEHWAILLAAGDGTRLNGLTTNRWGVAVPKQFCSLCGGGTLLSDALNRAARVVRRDRIVVVVAEQHRRWWQRELTGLPCRNLIVQPANRGTASGILLPLLSILERDRAAHVAIYPSDHFVRDEDVLARVMRTTMRELCGNELVLLGIRPEHAEARYGWIVPAADGTPRVTAFVATPDRVQAEACLHRGAVWNSFLLAARGAALLALCEQRVPRLTAALRATFMSSRRSRARAIAALYASLETIDFSRSVLQGSEHCLRLSVVPACGWTDLGTPERVAQCLEGLHPVRSRLSSTNAPIDLSEAMAMLASRNSEPSSLAEE